MDPSHPTDDELIDHLGGEGGPDGRARIDAHLAACALCGEAWAELTAALTLVHDAVPEPPPDFERVMWARVQAALPPRPRWTWRVLAPVATLAAAVVAGVTIGRLVPAPAPEGRTAPAAVAAAGAPARLTPTERVLFTALDEHLAAAEALLVELRNAADRDDLSVERMTADDLVALGRLYRQSAESAGRAGVVRVLDDLEPVLVEVARAPDRMDGRERQWLRARIVEDNLLFKVRAMSTDLRELSAKGDQ